MTASIGRWKSHTHSALVNAIKTGNQTELWPRRPNWICRSNCGTQTHTRGMMNVWHGKSRRVFTPIRRNDKRHHSALTPEIGAVWIHLSLGATGFIIIFTAGYALGSAYGESWCSSSSRIISAITPPRANMHTTNRCAHYYFNLLCSSECAVCQSGDSRLRCHLNNELAAG